MVQMVDCWTKTLEFVKPIPDEFVEEAREIYEEDSFTEFLDFCRERGCFGDCRDDEECMQSDIWILVKYGVCDYEAGDSTYNEENTDRKIQLLDVLFDE